MGVPQFFSWLVSKYKSQLLVNATQQRPDYFYLDFNCAIHPTVKDAKITTLEEMYQACCKYLEILVNKANPTKMVYIAIDGVAPMAKIKQQRYRRFKAIQDRRELDAIDRKHNKWKAQKFDFNMISPGTDFMSSLHKHIATFTRGKWPHLRVILNSSNHPGEGEHKIMKHIRNHTEPDSNIVIYGLDSDLIFLSLINSSAKAKMHLLRESKAFDPKAQDSFTYFDINLFRKLIVQAMMNIKTADDHNLTNVFNNAKENDEMVDERVVPDGNETASGPKKDTVTVNAVVNELITNLDEDLQTKYIVDYVALSFMLGNDFLPHIPNLIIRENAIMRLIENYTFIQSKYPGMFLVSDDRTTFNYKFFIKLLEFIANTEDADLANSLQNSIDRINKFKNTYRYRSSEPYERDILIWEYVENTYTNTLLLGKPGWKARYYTHYLGQFGPNLVDKMCLDYLTGMIWMLRYYTGDCPSWSWYYKHRAAPAISDLFRYMENYNDQTMNNLIEFSSSGPISPAEQLLLILPPQSHNLLPPAHARLMLNIDSPIIGKYPINFNIDMQNHTHRWECYPILPDFDPALVHQLVSALQSNVPLAVEDDVSPS